MTSNHQLPLEYDICENKHGGNTESVEAHDSVISRKTEIQKRLWIAIEKAGEEGRTCEELEMVFGLKHQTCSARLSELKANGYVKKQGVRPTVSGRNAAVLVVAKNFVST